MGPELLLTILTEQATTANEHANRYQPQRFFTSHNTNVYWDLGRFVELIFVHQAAVIK
jgi:hypothetical protein